MIAWIPIALLLFAPVRIFAICATELGWLVDSANRIAAERGEAGLQFERSPLPISDRDQQIALQAVELNYRFGEYSNQRQEREEALKKKAGLEPLEIEAAMLFRQWERDTNAVEKADALYAEYEAKQKHIKELKDQVQSQLDEEESEYLNRLVNRPEFAAFFGDEGLSETNADLHFTLTKEMCDLLYFQQANFGLRGLPSSSIFEQKPSSSGPRGSSEEFQALDQAAVKLSENRGTPEAYRTFIKRFVLRRPPGNQGYAYYAEFLRDLEREYTPVKQHLLGTKQREERAMGKKDTNRN